MATVPELLELFRAALRERLREDGWTELDDPACAAEFAHPIDEEFIAVAEIDRMTASPDRVPLLITDVNAAVGYLPLRRLWPLLDDGAAGQRFARQLGRWIDSGGDPRLRTESPPPPRYDQRVESIGAMWSNAWDEQYAIQAVQRVAGGRSRDELRALLEAELARRELSKTPIWIEQTLDTLSLSRTEQWQRTAEMRGRIGAGLARAVRDRKLPDRSVPELLAPPARAAYAVPRHRDRRRTTVLLDPGARGWLDDVDDALPKALDNPEPAGTPGPPGRRDLIAARSLLASLRMEATR